MLPLAIPAPVRLYACAECGRLCTDGSHAPGTIEGEEGAWRWEPGPWLCAGCSGRVWGAYLAACAHRRRVIEESRRAGWPLTESQYRARVARRDDQLRLWGP